MFARRALRRPGIGLVGATLLGAGASAGSVATNHSAQETAQLDAQPLPEAMVPAEAPKASSSVLDGREDDADSQAGRNEEGRAPHIHGIRSAKAASALLTSEAAPIASGGPDSGDRHPRIRTSVKPRWIIHRGFDDRHQADLLRLIRG